MNRPMHQKLRQQHQYAKSVLAYRKSERKQDAKALAELIYDVFKEKNREKMVK